MTTAHHHHRHDDEEARLNTQDAWRRLEELRWSEERNPEAVVRLATRLLCSSAALLDPRASASTTDLRWWATAEQLYIAALDTGRWELARALLAKMERRFPSHSNTRTRRLRGMLLEATGDSSGAMAVYTQLVATDPTDLPSMKRQIALLRSGGDYAAAIAQLNVLLRIFSADTESWLELAELYVLVQRPRLAAFCYEEAVLACPHNHFLWSRCAEALYTCGEFLTARKYFARATELSDAQDIRALLGLCMACQALQCNKQQQQGSHDGVVNRDLHAWAVKKLATLLPLAAPMLARQRTLFI